MAFVKMVTRGNEMAETGYKIVRTKTSHKCEECRGEIPIRGVAVVDILLDLSKSMTGCQYKGYFHAPCYRETQLTLNPTEIQEFDNKVLSKIREAPNG